MPNNTQRRIRTLAQEGFRGRNTDFASRLGVRSVNRHLRALTRAGVLIRYRYGHSFNYRIADASAAAPTQPTAPTPRVSLGQRTFGIEIELYVPSQHATSASQALNYVANALQAAGVAAQAYSYTHQLTPHWKCTTDSSICTGLGAGFGVEVVSPVLSGEAGEEEVRKACTALVAAGCRVNASCGLHVHHGASGYGTVSRQALHTTYARLESVLDTLMPPSRRANANIYCRSAASSAFGDTRYCKINASVQQARHTTVEFRQHSGTVEAKKILPWVRLTRAMMEYRNQATLAQVSTLSGLCATLGLTAEDTNYWTARQAQLAGAEMVAA